MGAGTHTLYVSLIGCGAIGKTLVKAIESGLAGNVQLQMVYDRNLHRAFTLAETLKKKPDVAKSPEKLFNSQILNSL